MNLDHSTRLCVSLAVALFYGCRSTTANLEKSLHVVMVDRLHCQYSKIAQHLIESTDSSGVWRLQVNDGPVNLESKLKSAGLRQADHSDEMYYKAMMRQTFNSNEDLSEFRVYRGELPLGPGSICESLSCNIEVLVSDTSRHVYVAVSKI